MARLVVVALALVVTSLTCSAISDAKEKSNEASPLHGTDTALNAQTLLDMLHGSAEAQGEQKEAKGMIWYIDLLGIRILGPP